jgi:hypothetical protein
MKKIISICLIFLAILWFAMLINSCTPVKYVMIDPKDSSSLIEIRKRIIYEDVYEPQMPLYFYNGIYNRPFIIQRPIVIPSRPVIHYDRNYARPFIPNGNYRQSMPPRPPRKN